MYLKQGSPVNLLSNEFLLRDQDTYFQLNVHLLLNLNRGDGSCKQDVALLFDIIDHVISMEDRSSNGVTDTAASY